MVSQGLRTLLHGKTFYSVVRLGFLCPWTQVLAVVKRETTFPWIRIEQKLNRLYDVYEMDEEEDGVKAVGGRSVAQLDNRFNEVIKVNIVVFNKYFLQIHTERPSGVP